MPNIQNTSKRFGGLATPLKNKKNNYLLLERFVFTRFCIFLSILVVALYTIASCIRGLFGDWIIYLLMHMFHFKEPDAAFFYQTIIRHNVYYIVFIILLISIVFLCRYMIHSMCNYFSTIDTAIESLGKENTSITLPQELSYLTVKLQMCQEILENNRQATKIAEQKKNDLVLYIAHDIKTPLTSVIGYLELLQEFPDIPIEKRAKYISISLSKANRLEQLLNELFEITRWNLDSMNVIKKEFNFTFMLEQLIDEFYPMYHAKKLTVEPTIVPNCMILGDSDKLSRVFNNVLKNAIAYSDPDTPITITTTKVSQQIITTITNIGKTIDKEHLETIFESFFRLDNARSSSGGAGLGLAIAKKIVEAHQGTIVASSAQRKTSFVITLPIGENI